MSFREKNAWIAVLTTLAVWGHYFWSVLGAILDGSLDGDAAFRLFLVSMGITLVVMIGLNLVAAAVARQRMDAPPDERERAVDALANRVGLTVIELSGVVLVGANSFISGYARETFAADPAGGTAIIFANALLFLLVAAAVIREAIQIVCFRMMDA